MEIPNIEKTINITRIFKEAWNKYESYQEAKEWLITKITNEMNAAINDFGTFWKYQEEQRKKEIEEQ